MLKSFLKYLKGFHPRVRCTRKISRLLAQGNLPAAEEIASRTRHKYSANPTVIILYAKVQSALQNHDAVSESLSGISNLSAAPEHLLFEASLLLQQAGGNELAKRFLQHLDEARHFSAASKALAMQALDDRDYDEAVELFTRSVAHGEDASWGAVIRAVEECALAAAEASRKWLVDFDYRGGAPKFYFKLLSIFDSKCGDFESSRRNIQKATAQSLAASGRKLPLVENGPPLPPKFLIIGAMKCGTTTLHQLIASHPKFVAPIEKEIQFFQFSSLQRDWYLDHFPRLDQSGGYFTGDASPGYYAFDIVQRIAEMIPDVKLLFIQRDPADRAISHLRHNNRIGFSSVDVRATIRDIDELERMICDDPERAEDALLEKIRSRTNCNMFLILGLYELLLRRWRKRFGADQLMVLQLEELNEAPTAVMREVFEFLEVEPVPIEMVRENSGEYVQTDETTMRVKARLREFYQRVEERTT